MFFSTAFLVPLCLIQFVTLLALLNVKGRRLSPVACLGAPPLIPANLTRAGVVGGGKILEGPSSAV